MSAPALAPAREADAGVSPSGAASPARSTRRAVIAQPVAARVATPARRKRHHLGFVLFAAVALGLPVLGLVTLNAFVAQNSFRIDHLRARVDEQSERYQSLERQAAQLSAPDRIDGWARRHGMQSPEDVSVLYVPRLRASVPRLADAVDDPTGGPQGLAPDGVSLKPVAEGSG